jgi:hypothetical protein
MSSPLLNPNGDGDDVADEQNKPNPAKTLSTQEPKGIQDYIFEFLTGITKPDLEVQSRSGAVFPDLLTSLSGNRGITYDLPAHAEATRLATERAGLFPALLAGGVQEAQGAADAFRAGEPIFSSTGASIADLLANMYGATQESDALASLFGLGGVTDEDFTNMILALAEAGY